MRFFFDNNLSHRLAEGMKAFGENVEHLRDRFPPDISDEVWLKYVGQQDMVLLTKDIKIIRQPATLSLMRKYRIRAFFLKAKNLNHCQIIQLIVRNWSLIKEEAQKASRPCAYRIPRKGKIFKSLL